MRSVDANSMAGKSLEPPLQLHKVLLSEPYHPNSVSPGVSLVNTSGQTMRSVEFKMQPFSDPKHSFIPASWELFSGPIPASEEKIVIWGGPWHDASIYCVELKGAKVTFDDGSVLDYDDKDISKLLVDPESNYCIVPVHDRQ